MARSIPGKWAAALVFGIMAVALGGCGSLSGGLHASLSLSAPQAQLADETPSPAATPIPMASEGASAVTAASMTAETPSATTGTAPSETVLLDAAPPRTGIDIAAVEAAIEPLDEDDLSETVLALVDSMMLAQAEARASSDSPIEEYDPWEKFNEVMFDFNLKLDRYIVKPIAKAYNFIMPDELQHMISRGFSNINVVPRLVNNILQGKWAGAGRELARFLINSTVGIGGLWDMARQEWDIQPSKADFGQTLGKWGSGPGPYLILPLLPPMTVRDGIGMGVDGAMDPLSYVLPFIWDRLVMKIADMINERSLNLDLFQGFEETTVDFYAAVRNAYLQRRYRLIHEE